jgi:hypothetical protein
LTEADRIAQSLAGFAAAYPGPPESDVMRAEGAAAGYPPCCIEFFASVILFVFGRTAEALAYWKRAGAAAGHSGYIPCPACLVRIEAERHDG